MKQALPTGFLDTNTVGGTRETPLLVALNILDVPPVAEISEVALH